MPGLSKIERCPWFAVVISLHIGTIELYALFHFSLIEETFTIVEKTYFLMLFWIVCLRIAKCRLAYYPLTAINIIVHLAIDGT